MFSVILSLMSKAKIRSMASKDPEVTMESQQIEEGEPHRVVNPNEAAIMVHSLDEALTVLEAQVAETEERDVLTEVVTKFKEAISRVLPAMMGQRWIR